MSTAQWGLLCGCAFVVAVGAGLGVLTPTPQSWAEIVSAFRSPLQANSPDPTETDVVRRGGPSIWTVTEALEPPFPIRGRIGSDCALDGDAFRIADIDAPESAVKFKVDKDPAERSRIECRRSHGTGKICCRILLFGLRHGMAGRRLLK